MARITTGGPGAIGAVAPSGNDKSISASAAAHRAMGDLAGRMAASVGSALGLTGEQAGQWQGNGNDPYEIEDMVEALAAELGGSASEAGELSRVFHAFVQESAALFASRPESRSLAFVRSVISEPTSSSDTVASLPAIARHVEAATEALRGTIR